MGNQSLQSYYNLPKGQRIKNIDLLENISIAQPSNDQSVQNADLMRDFNNFYVDFSLNNDNDSISKI
jgi:hypothetical protein